MSRPPHRRARRSLPALAAVLVAAAGAALATAGVTSSPRSNPGPTDARSDSVDAITAPQKVQKANGPPKAHPRSDLDLVKWRPATSHGTHAAGSLDGCVRLPAMGKTFVSWDPVLRAVPNRADRRCGTARLVRVVVSVAAKYAKAYPGASRVVVGDLSRPGGGDFGVVHGDLGDGHGHSSHQNGLDVDIYYPRGDGREHGPKWGGPQDVVAIDHKLAQDLVDRFAAAGAKAIFVGTDSGLTGPPGVVVPLIRHNDHMHVRLGE